MQHLRRWKATIQSHLFTLYERGCQLSEWMNKAGWIKKPEVTNRCFKFIGWNIQFISLLEEYFLIFSVDSIVCTSIIFQSISSICKGTFQKTFFSIIQAQENLPLYCWEHPWKWTSSRGPLPWSAQFSSCDCAGLHSTRLSVWLNKLYVNVYRPFIGQNIFFTFPPPSSLVPTQNTKVNVF